MGLSRPRLFWLTQGSSPDLPSQRLRVLEIMPYLEGAFEQAARPAPTTIGAIWRMRHELRAADIVVLQKELVSLPVFLLLRRLAKRLVYDFDDAVYLRLQRDGECRTSRKRSRRFATICRSADLVVAGNPILEEHARHSGACKTAILPTGVSFSDTTASDAGHDPVRLGWIGTNVNLPYIEALEPIFLELQGSGIPFVLHVMAGRPPVLGEFSAVQFFPWSKETENHFLAAIDIGLMPLADNEHTRGKCAYKALQYMSFGKPVVVSDVGVNAEWTMGAGFAVRSTADMTAALRRLIADAGLRAEMGRRGRERIAREFARTVIATRLEKYLMQLMES